MNYQMNDVYESMVMAVARVGREVSGVDHALRGAIHQLAHAIPWIEDTGAEPEVTRAAAHEAYVSVLALGQHLTRAREDGVREVDAAYAALIAVLDALDPHVGSADRGLRAVLLDGEPLDAVARRLACA